MTKRIQFLFLVLSAFAFFSCSNLKEESSTVSFSLSQNSARAITSESSGDWRLKISLSGGINKEESFSIQKGSAANAQSFTVGNLSPGETVTVDVSIYCGKIRYYKAKETKSLTLESGGNNLDIVLVRVTSDGTITAESFAEKVSVGAAYESDSSTTYKTGAAIPYTNSNLTFSLSGLDDESATYAWYLNDNALDSTTSTASFNPYQESNIKISDTNTISCKVTISGTTYVAEMSFTFTTARSAAVWFDGINASSTTYALKQLADNTDTSTTASELVTATSSTLYCFDSSCNLWTGTYDSNNSATPFNLKKYSLILTTGLFNTTAVVQNGSGYALSATLTESGLVDMSFDTKNGCLFVLSKNSDDKYFVTAIDTEYDTIYKNSTAIDISDDAIQIAAYDNTVYIAGNDHKIYSGKATLTDAADEEDDNTLSIENLSAITSSFASSNFLTGWSSENDDEDSLFITDLQIGDGLGNDTSTLYALVREYSESIVSGTNYSRGALVSIDIDSKFSTNTYGWANVTAVNMTDSDGKTNDSLYAPTSTSITVDGGGFYGPTHFAAVVPKELVILDDGLSYEEKGTLKNQDSLVEFDIAGNSLSRGASVSATKPSYSSGFTWN